MKPQDLSPEQKYYLGHRGLIETCFDQLKNLCDMDHSRHRSVKNFLVNLFSALIAYTLMDTFPQIPTYVFKLGKGESLNIVLI